MRIALHGLGNMGRSIKAASAERGWTVMYELDHDLGNFDELQHLAPDVVIDFSAAAAVPALLERALPAGMRVVVGTTGWQDRLTWAQQLAEQSAGALLVGSNFSIGVNLLFRLNTLLAQWLAPHFEFDPFIEERHHAQKVDAPSGTALQLAKDLMVHCERKTAIVTAAELAHRRPEHYELSVGSVRAGKFVGTHTVGWTSSVETIELSHTAYSREGFAQGALFAAAWLQGKQGFFQFEDVFEIPQRHG